MGRLYLIPSVDSIDRVMELSKEYDTCFEYNDFFLPAVLDNEEKVKERIAFYKGLPRDRSRDTLHGAFLDITVHSDDRLIREASVFRVRQCLDIASQLGIRAVIFHTNMIPNFKSPSYMENWVKRNAIFWRLMLQEYKTLEIYIENMFDEDPDMLLCLAKEMESEERFGVCFDYAHASISKVAVKDWVECLAPYIRHMHINDNDLKVDQHRAVGQGLIEWKVYTELMENYRINSSVLVEVSEIGKQQDSLLYMKENGIYPFDREV